MHNKEKSSETKDKQHRDESNLKYKDNNGRESKTSEVKDCPRECFVSNSIQRTPHFKTSKRGRYGLTSKTREEANWQAGPENTENELTTRTHTLAVRELTHSHAFVDKGKIFGRAKLGLKRKKHTLDTASEGGPILLHELQSFSRREI